MWLLCRATPLAKDGWLSSRILAHLNLKLECWDTKNPDRLSAETSLTDRLMRLAIKQWILKAELEISACMKNIGELRERKWAS